MSHFKIQNYKRIVVLTGAGVSAASGIATFRDSNGLWENHRIEDVATPEAFEKDPYIVWRFYSMRRLSAGVAKPNAAHFALDKFSNEFAGDLTLITQNVDGLHRRAQRVGHLEPICMHGTLERSRCTHCGHVWWDDMAWLPEIGLPRRSILLDETTLASEEALVNYNVKVDGGLPLSPCCGAVLRPHIVWFGEEPFYMSRILGELEKCDLFVSVGTSGVVYPAAAFLEIAHSHGATTLVMNKESLPQQSMVDIFIQGSAEDLLPEFFNLK